MPLNDSNFMMWFPAGESATGHVLPRPFMLEPESLSPVVWLVPGERMQFYINSPGNTPLNGPIRIESEADIVTALANQSLDAVFFPAGSRTYGGLTVPNMAEGFVRFLMGTYHSQWLWLTTAAKAATYSVLVQFSNTGRRL